MNKTDAPYDYSWEKVKDVTNFFLIKMFPNISKVDDPVYEVYMNALPRAITDVLCYYKAYPETTLEEKDKMHYIVSAYKQLSEEGKIGYE